MPLQFAWGVGIGNVNLATGHIFRKLWGPRSKPGVCRLLPVAGCHVGKIPAMWYHLFESCLIERNTHRHNKTFRVRPCTRIIASRKVFGPCSWSFSSHIPSEKVLASTSPFRHRGEGRTGQAWTIPPALPRRAGTTRALRGLANFPLDQKLLLCSYSTSCPPAQPSLAPHGVHYQESPTGGGPCPLCFTPVGL